MSIQLYASTDFSLATSLSIFVPIVRLDTRNSDRVVFLFEQTEELSGLINDYWNGNLRVDPLRFYSQLKTLKSRLRSDMRVEEGR